VDEAHRQQQDAAATPTVSAARRGVSEVKKVGDVQCAARANAVAVGLLVSSHSHAR
jgi:hypothetical protein